MSYNDFKLLEEKKVEIEKIVGGNGSKYEKVIGLYEIVGSKSLVKDILNISYNMVYNYIVKYEERKELKELRDLKEKLDNKKSSSKKK